MDTNLPTNTHTHTHSHPCPAVLNVSSLLVFYPSTFPLMFDSQLHWDWTQTPRTPPSLSSKHNLRNLQKVNHAVHCIYHIHTVGLLHMMLFGSTSCIAFDTDGLPLRNCCICWFKLLFKWVSYWFNSTAEVWYSLFVCSIDLHCVTNY